ncbi:DoxX family membrane protein [Opitutus sp. ER46]|uniref:MauE/DoxX family redox-associated membrane protein n=1 Tax=Opitutus sp. ER46 TaxID=2161864 RepID=UPI000D301B57|nr:DoxX family membrane protein [Opitutus sp. ER46]PTX95606.1 hypothetical protein DB354_09320 [Opitutus sp. ER46]
MNPDDAPAPTPGARPGCEYAAAFLLLRLFLGLRTLLSGVEKFENQGTYGLGNYAQNAAHLAQGITNASFLPLWLTRGYALALGYGLLVVGGMLLLGIKSRLALMLAGAVYLSLAFGLMAVQEAEGVAWLAIHIGLIAGALVLVRHERFALWPTNRS